MKCPDTSQRTTLDGDDDSGTFTIDVSSGQDGSQVPGSTRVELYPSSTITVEPSSLAEPRFAVMQLEITVQEVVDSVTFVFTAPDGVTTVKTVTKDVPKGAGYQTISLDTQDYPDAYVGKVEISFESQYDFYVSDLTMEACVHYKATTTPAGVPTTTPGPGPTTTTPGAVPTTTTPTGPGSTTPPPPPPGPTTTEVLVETTTLTTTGFTFTRSTTAGTTTVITTEAVTATPTATTSGTTAAATTTEYMCVFDMNSYIDNFDVAPPANGVIGWIEKDSNPGQTAGDEVVRIDDEIDPGVVIHVRCNNCTCTENLGISCTTEGCERDCEWLEWSTWGECDQQCDVGSRMRNRTFIPAQYDGLPCNGTAEEFEDCNTDPCPCDDGNWSPWGEWRNCSASCDGGTRTRSRTCNNPAPCPTGKPCEGSSQETESCNTQPCEQNCTDGKIWKTDECNCPLTCANLDSASSCVEDDAWEPGCCCPDGQVQDYQGFCVNITDCPCIYNGTEYPPNSFVDKECETCQCLSGVMNCNPTACDKDCVVTEWGEWGLCSVNCGGGERNRYRQVTQDQQGNGELCPHLNETESCEPDPCPKCVDHTGQEYDKGDNVNETECRICYCNENSVIECEDRDGSRINGGWREWTEFGSCNQTCDGGMRRRTRVCDSPLPACDGDPCEGPSEDWEPCNEDVPCSTTTTPTPTATTTEHCYNKYFDYGALQSGAIQHVNGTPSSVASTGPAMALRGAPGGAFFQPDNQERFPEYQVYLNPDSLLTLVRVTFAVRGASEVIIRVLTPNGTIYTKDVNITNDFVDETLDTEGDFIRLTFKRSSTSVPVTVEDLLIEATDCSPCGLNEQYATEACEKPCEMLADANVTCYDLDYQCACVDGYYRNNHGQCVASDECNFCYMDGQIVPHGHTIRDEENCVIRICDAGTVDDHDINCAPCQKGYERDPQPNDCCHCKKTPSGQGEKCRLQIVNEVVEVVNSNGVYCRTNVPIDLSYCSGACSSHDRPVITFGDNVYEHDVECKCCKGQGQERTYDVYCDDQSTSTVKIYQMSSCGCEDCPGEDAVAPYDPLQCVSKTYDFAALSSNEFSLSGPASTSSHTVTFALSGSGDYYEAPVSVPNPWDSPDGVSVSFKMGDRNVFVKKIDFRVANANSVIYNFMFKEGHEPYQWLKTGVPADLVSKTFEEPMKAKEVVLRFERSTDTSSITLEDLTMDVFDCTSSGGRR